MTDEPKYYDGIIGDGFVYATEDHWINLTRTDWEEAVEYGAQGPRAIWNRELTPEEIARIFEQDTESPRIGIRFALTGICRFIRGLFDKRSGWTYLRWVPDDGGWHLIVEVMARTEEGYEHHYYIDDDLKDICVVASDDPETEETQK